MPPLHEYTFDIDAFTPTSIPAVRLAEYIRELSLLFGSEEGVHFIRIDEGSGPSLVSNHK